LANILDIFRTANQPGDRSEDPLPVSRDNLTERGIIALTGTFDQVEAYEHGGEPGRQALPRTTSALTLLEAHP
jgi:hypothetical protein